MEITSISTLIKCFHLHREKVRGWTSRYPQDEEISSGSEVPFQTIDLLCITFNLALKLFHLYQFHCLNIVQFRDNEPGTGGRAQEPNSGYEDKVNSLERNPKSWKWRDFSCFFCRQFIALKIHFDCQFQRPTSVPDNWPLKSKTIKVNFESYKLSTEEAARVLAAASLMMTLNLVCMFRFYYLPKSWKCRDWAK